MVLIHERVGTSLRFTGRCSSAARRATARGLQPEVGQTRTPVRSRGVRAMDPARADPSVLCLCEHPARLGVNGDGRSIDFWVQRHDQAEMLLLDRGDLAQLSIEPVGGVLLRVVARAELAAAGIWIDNWKRMLPVINATRGLLSKGLTEAVVKLVREPAALSQVEHALSAGDPSLIRGAIFEVLRTGRLRAPALQTQQLSHSTLLEPL